MSTALSTSNESRTVVPAVAAGLPVLGEPSERGRLTIEDRVVERVAGYAVTLVPDAAAAPRRVLGVNVGHSRPQDQAHVSAEVTGSTATVHATIAVRWPTSARSVADAIRNRIRMEVTRITGVTVDHIDVDVVSMSVPDQTQRRVL